MKYVKKQFMQSVREWKYPSRHLRFGYGIMLGEGALLAGSAPSSYFGEAATYAIAVVLIALALGLHWWHTRKDDLESVLFSFGGAWMIAGLLALTLAFPLQYTLEFPMQSLVIWLSGLFLFATGCGQLGVARLVASWKRRRAPQSDDK